MPMVFAMGKAKFFASTSDSSIFEDQATFDYSDARALGKSFDERSS